MTRRFAVVRAAGLPALLWRAGAGWRMAATGVLGGGIGARRWVLNAQVPADYTRRDPDRHLAGLARELGLAGPGVGMMTAVDVAGWSAAADGGVEVAATVGLGHPIWAAAGPDGTQEADAPGTRVGTINLVVVVPVALTDAALVNMVVTVTEAKVQALLAAGVAASGTASDAVCVAARRDGPVASFGGPRALWGFRAARAAHAAVLTGARRWLRRVADRERPAGPVPPG